jgi:hypothetical protein
MAKRGSDDLKKLSVLQMNLVRVVFASRRCPTNAGQLASSKDGLAENIA